MEILVIIMAAATAGTSTLAVLWWNEAKIWEGTARAMSEALDRVIAEKHDNDEPGKRGGDTR